MVSKPWNWTTFLGRPTFRSALLSRLTDFNLRLTGRFLSLLFDVNLILRLIFPFDGLNLPFCLKIILIGKLLQVCTEMRRRPVYPPRTVSPAFSEILLKKSTTTTKKKDGSEKPVRGGWTGPCRAGSYMYGFFFTSCSWFFYRTFSVNFWKGR